MLTALSGALTVQYLGYFSIWMSVGMLVMALAGLILGTTLFNNSIIAVIMGSILYQTIIAFTFELHVDQVWNKLITALLIVVLFSIKKIVSSTKVKAAWLA